MSGFDELSGMFDGGDSEVPFDISDSPRQSVSAPSPSESLSRTSNTSVSVNNGGVSDDFEIGFSKEMEDALTEVGITVGDIGVKVSKVPIEKYKASSAKLDRIAFLTKRVMPVKYHYLKGVGSVVCFKGKCCEMCGVPQVRYLFPIAVYQTDSEGSFSGKKVELKILSAGDDLYKSIITINRGSAQYGGIDKVDLLVTCTDDQYQKLALTFAGPATWRRYQAIADFLSNRWKQDGANAYLAVARKVDAKSFSELIGSSVGDDSSQQSYNPAVNSDLSKFFEE